MDPGVTAPGVTGPRFTLATIRDPKIMDPGIPAAGTTVPEILNPGVTAPGVTAPGVVAAGIAASGFAAAKITAAKGSPLLRANRQADHLTGPDPGAWAHFRPIEPHPPPIDGLLEEHQTGARQELSQKTVQSLVGIQGADSNDHIVSAKGDPAFSIFGCVQEEGSVLKKTQK